MPRKKLSDKLNQPAKIVAEKKISLVSANKNSDIARVSLRPRTSVASRPSSRTKKETFLVRLKIDKKTYQNVFKNGGNNNNNTTDKSELQSSNSNLSYDPDTLFSQTLEFNTDEEVKKVNIPDLYQTMELDIQPECMIFKHYCDLDNDLLNKKINSNITSDKKIHLILPNFDRKEWPDTSPYACWNCTETFNIPPIGIPALEASTPYKDEYRMEGNFCSFNCAARYLFDNHKGNESQAWCVYEILNFIYNEINDNEDEKDDFVQIKLAPDRLCLKKFGGNVTLEEYRTNAQTNINYKVFKGQLIPALYHIQENTDLRMLRRK
jgi:hypothetical protein